MTVNRQAQKVVIHQLTLKHPIINMDGYVTYAVINIPPHFLSSSPEPDITSPDETSWTTQTAYDVQCYNVPTPGSSNSIAMMPSELPKTSIRLGQFHLPVSSDDVQDITRYCSLYFHEGQITAFESHRSNMRVNLHPPSFPHGTSSPLDPYNWRSPTDEIELCYNDLSRRRIRKCRFMLPRNIPGVVRIRLRCVDISRARIFIDFVLDGPAYEGTKVVSYAIQY